MLDLNTIIGKTFSFDVFENGNIKLRLPGLDVYGKPPTSLPAGKGFKAKVECAYYAVAQNGGRSRRFDVPRTHEEFWNDWQKKRWAATRSIEGKLCGPYQGDFDRAAIIVHLDYQGIKITLDDNLWEYGPPLEWYAELYADAVGDVSECYTTAEEAESTIVAKGTSEDMFGQRYFPVMVFDSIPEDLNGITYWGKCASKPIQLQNKVVVGVRVKPHYLARLVEACYNAGGKISKTREWDW